MPGNVPWLEGAGDAVIGATGEGAPGKGVSGKGAFAPLAVWPGGG